MFFFLFFLFFCSGTDDGITFTSPNAKSSPQMPIQKLTGDLHKHPQASFHRNQGDVIHPVAQLRIQLQRLSDVCNHRTRPPFPPKPREYERIKKYKTRSHFISPDLNTREVEIYTVFPRMALIWVLRGALNRGRAPIRGGRLIKNY